MDLLPDWTAQQTEIIEACSLKGLQWVTKRWLIGCSLQTQGRTSVCCTCTSSRKVLGVTGDVQTMMRAVLFVLPPPETFPPRLTMTVTSTDRLTGASADRRGEKSTACRRETESVRVFILSERRRTKKGLSHWEERLNYLFFGWLIPPTSQPTNRLTNQLLSIVDGSKNCGNSKQTTCRHYVA